MFRDILEKYIKSPLNINANTELIYHLFLIPRNYFWSKSTKVMPTKKTMKAIHNNTNVLIYTFANGKCLIAFLIGIISRVVIKIIEFP